MSASVKYLRVFFWLYVLSEGVRSVIVADVRIFSNMCFLAMALILLYSMLKDTIDHFLERPAWFISYDCVTGKPSKEEVYDSKSYLESLKLKEVG